MFTLWSDDRIVKMFSLVSFENSKRKKKVHKDRKLKTLTSTLERENSGRRKKKSHTFEKDMKNEITNTVLGGRH